MPEQTEWYNNLKNDVETLKTQMGADARDFYLERFVKIAQRIDAFATDCQQCHEYQAHMDNILKELSADTQQISKEQKRSFLGNMNTILSHLKKTHGLISDGQNTGIWLAIGAGMGIALGAAFENPAIGISIGLSFGLILGISLDARARKAGKVF